MMQANYAHFCNLVGEHSGLILTQEKLYLVETRLAPIAERLKLPSVDALLTKLQAAPDPKLVVECVEALATHESSFFRDSAPFVQLSKFILPRLITQKSLSKSLRIWSAACSTGQEPYSIAMTLQDHAEQLRDWHIEIVATDMVSSAVEHAREGFYTDFETSRGLKPELLQRWFKKVEGGYLIDASLRRNIHFGVHNLLEPLHERGTFDLIFCRNVLIYFNRDKKIEVLKRLGSVLARDGLLILGSAETVIGLCDSYESYEGQHGLFHRKIGASV